MITSTTKVLLIEEKREGAPLAAAMSAVNAVAALHISHVQRLDEGLRLLAQSPADVILADLSLPDSSGLDTFRRLQQAAPGRPIIVLSRNGNGPQAVSEGAHDYIDADHADVYTIHRAVWRAAERAPGGDERLFRALFESIPHGLLLVAANGLITKANLSVSLILGWSPAELAGRDLFGLIHPDDLRQAWALFDQIAHQSRSPSAGQFRCRGKDGQWQWVEISGANLLEVSDVAAIAVAVRDITEHKQTENELRESEARYRAIVEDQDVFVCRFLPDGTFTFVNSAYCRYVGKEASELVGRSFLDWALPEERERLKVYLSSFTPEHPTNTFIQHDTGPTGEDRWRQWHDRAIFNAEGRLLEFQGTGRDITAQKQAEVEIRELARYSSENPSPIFRIRKDGILLYANPACAGLLKHWSGSVGQPVPEGWVSFILEALISGLPREEEIAIGDRVFDFSIVPFVEAGYVNVYARDITERQQRERELEAIASVSAALRSASNRDEMLPIVLDQALDLLGAESAAMAIHNPASGEIITELARGRLENWSGLRLPTDRSISGWVIANGKPYFTNDARNDPHLYRPDLFDENHAFACMPLITHSETIGALWISRPGALAQAEVRVLTAIADIAANAIRRAALHEETQRRLEHLQALRTIDSAISSTLDLRVTLKILLDQVMSQLQVDAADVLVFRPQTNRLEYAAGRGFRTRAIESASVPANEGLIGRAVSERRLISAANLAHYENEFRRGALVADEGFVSYCCLPLVAKGITKGVLEIFHRAPHVPDPEWKDYLEILAGQAGIAIEHINLFIDLQRFNTELALAYDTTLEGWSRALDLRDESTEGHTRRVAEMAVRLAEAMGLRNDQLINVRRGALLHDIGKMGIPDSILLKPGPLTADEMAIMHKHPEYAYNMLSPIAFLRPALDIPYCHHEHWDGGGYPRGLKGVNIPLAARIFAVVDVWDALCSDRPYRPAWPVEKAREHIISQSGQQFDPQVVDAFLKLLNNTT